MFETSQYNKFEKYYSLMDLKVKNAILQTLPLKNLSEVHLYGNKSTLA